jgi:K+/H+ antiporter YhaU regulatory subunit KhtT
MLPGGLKSGADIDPYSLEPIERSITEQEFEQGQREEKTLREQAEFLNIMHSEGGAKLVELVSRKLEQRIEELMASDQQAAAYAAILREVGHRHVLAQAAVKKLYERQYHG